jgi:glutaredoxin
VDHVRSQHTVELLTRAGCSLCAKAAAVLGGLADELGFAWSAIDVDSAAAAGDPSLRAEYGDLLPVVLLDGVQHGYWEVDEARLREDLASP